MSRYLIFRADVRVRLLVGQVGQKSDKVTYTPTGIGDDDNRVPDNANTDEHHAGRGCLVRSSTVVAGSREILTSSQHSSSTNALRPSDIGTN
jgi:hypothetical protein